MTLTKLSSLIETQLILIDVTPNKRKTTSYNVNDLTFSSRYTKLIKWWSKDFDHKS